MKVPEKEGNAEGFEPGVTANPDSGSGIVTTSESQSLGTEESDSREPGASEENESLTLRRATGPRTLEGKQRSRHNALKLGLFSKIIVLKNESQAEFDALLNGLRKDLQPMGTLERLWVERLAADLWRLRRLIVADGKAHIGNGISFLELNELPHWDHLLRYETTLDRAIDRNLAQLERFQRMRLGQPVPPRINVNVSSS